MEGVELVDPFLAQVMFEGSKIGNGQIDEDEAVEHIAKVRVDVEAQEPGPATRALQIALSGWGYDFHHPANVARTNDLLVRQRVTGWIRDAAGAADAVERAYAHEFVPPATREHPFPAPEVARSIRAIRDLRDACATLAARIDTLEMPAGDGIWSRFSRERPLLEALVVADAALLAYAQTLRTAVLQLTPAMVDAAVPFDEPKAMLAQIEDHLRCRSDVLRL